MDRDALARQAKELVDLIAATPRAAGGEAEARARQLCAEMLRQNGFMVTEEPFAYSAFAGRYAVPLVGALLLGWFAFIGLADDGRHAEAAARSLPFLLLLPALGYMLARAAPPPGLMSRSATNLFAVRGERPTALLLAHLDSKSQPVPMLARIAGIIAAAGAAVACLAAAFPGRSLDLPAAFWISTCAAGAAGSLAMAASLVGDRSPGALDNATGVAAALVTAASLPAGTPLCVALTSAEELGLQGARALARGHPVLPARMVNFDGIDDVGTLTCMARRDSPLAARIQASARECVLQLKTRRVLPGIMVDALALEGAGREAVTISKGNLSTLARIHTPGDTPRRLSCRGVAEAADMVRNFLTREG
ncbi:MAG TPA: M28 family peptidase [Gemmatimonadaceae bacterium]|nr:M28 family peptidase [Gemmatimonadaceae bacterium]